MPPDLTSQAWLDRYLDEQGPDYLIAGEAYGFAPPPTLAASPRLERVLEDRGRVLYRVKDPPASRRPWPAPPPLLPQRSGARFD